MLEAIYHAPPSLICFAGEPLLNIEQAAEFLGYSVSGVRKLVRKGGLRYFQASKGACLRFKQEWLDDYVEAHSTPDPEPVAKLKRKKAAAARPPPSGEFWAY